MSREWRDLKNPPEPNTKVELLLSNGEIIDSEYLGYSRNYPEKFWNWKGAGSMKNIIKWRPKKKKNASVVIDDASMRNEAFEKLCKMSQAELKNTLKQRYNMSAGKGYLFHQGTVPILLTAHMDTVHKEQCRTIVYANGTISADEGIGGDDRCGIYMIEQIIDEYDCSVLFCEDEEIGSVGAKEFIKTELCQSLKGKFKYIIELDRANQKDAVFYDCDNPDFSKYILGKPYWSKATGTWSDCCTLGPALATAYVNFSCGYYNAHKTTEYVKLSEMYQQISNIKSLIADVDNADFYEFIEKKHVYTNAWPKYYYEDDYYDYSYNSYYNNQSTKKKGDYGTLELIVTTSDGKEFVTDGLTKADCWLDFFMENPKYSFSEVADYEFL